MVRMLVGLPVEWIGRVDELFELGCRAGMRTWPPAERHAADPALWLARAARLAPEG